MFLQDLRHGARTLARRPGFSIAAALSLALGVGVTTALFMVLDAVALRPLPYKDPSRLVWMTQLLRGSNTDEVTITADFLEWRRLNHSFSDLAGYNHQVRNLTGVEPAAEVRTVRASTSLLPMLGVAPALGRDFRREEDIAGGDTVALLGYDFWQRQFGGDRKILGRPITLDGRQFTVVGILPRSFVFPDADPVDLITPLGKDETRELQRSQYATVIFDVVGRLKPGVTPEQAHAELSAIQSHLPRFLPWLRGISIRMEGLHQHLFGSTVTAGWVLLAAAAFLLLIACANVGNLLLVRLAQRDRELAVRTALGGSRGRLIQQLLTESGLLGAVGCGLGILLAWCLRAPLVALSPYHLPGTGSLPFDARVLAFAVAAGMAATMLFGAAPAFRATGIHLAEAIRSGGAGAVGGRRSMRALSMVAAGEIAITIVLSTGASLTIESFRQMRYGGLGFRPERLVAANLHLTGPRYSAVTARAPFLADLLERARSLPGIESAAITTASEIPPGNGGRANSVFQIAGRVQAIDSGRRPIARFQQVSSSFFRLMNIPLLQGTLPQDSDRDVVVNHALAQKYFPGEDPIGHRIVFGASAGEFRTIAAVVGDVKTSGLAAAPEPAVYFSYRQAIPSIDAGLVIRSPLDAGAIAAELRRALAEIDPNQPLATVESMNERLSSSVSGPRFIAALLAVFASLALLLGMVGVYGVMACRVRWQLRELAVRQALGARPGDVIRHVLGQGLGVILPGVGLGLAGSFAAGRLIASLLYETKADDPLRLATVSAALFATAMAACSVPALRAARTHPLASLRQE